MEDSGLTLTDIIGLEGLTIIDLMAAIYFLKLFSKFEFLIFLQLLLNFAIYFSNVHYFQGTPKNWLLVRGGLYLKGTLNK
jgi:hypothetical protein